MSAGALSYGFPPGTVLTTATPAGYRRFAARAVAGRGGDDLERLGAAVLAWRMQRASGIRVLGADGLDAPAVATGLEVRLSLRVVAALGQEWRTLAPAQVVRVVDEPERRGFVYGTLPGHPAR